MGKRFFAHILIATCLGSPFLHAEETAGAPAPIEIMVSVAEQKLALVKDGAILHKYPISTSKFGLGDSNGSYRTPLGNLKVCEKIGSNLSPGSVIKGRNATGEVLPANSPGRDPIVTRILWLDGLESCNANARSRGIYIHGTVEESKLGQPVSYGCIRMRSRDVVELFNDTPVGTTVQIVADKFPHFHKAEPPKPEILLVSNKDGVKTTVGAHGQFVTFAPKAAEKPQPAPAPLVAQNNNKAPAKSAPQLVAEKSPEPAAKPPVPAPKFVAKTEAPEKLAAPIALGPTIVFSMPKVVAKPLASAATEPRVVLHLMSGSILTYDLHNDAKAGHRDDAKSEPRASEPPAEPRSVVLQILAAVDFLGSPDEVRRRMPLDYLSAHLLNPPEPQLRLAVRAASPTPDL